MESYPYQLVLDYRHNLPLRWKSDFKPLPSNIGTFIFVGSVYQYIRMLSDNLRMHLEWWSSQSTFSIYLVCQHRLHIIHVLGERVITRVTLVFVQHYRQVFQKFYLNYQTSLSLTLYGI